MKARHFSGLRVRALALGVVPAFVLSVLLGGYLVNARLDDLESAQQSRGQAIANELAAISVYGLFSGNTESLEASAKEFMGRSDMASIRISDQDGHLLVSLGSHSLFAGDKGGQPQNLYHFRATVAGINSSKPLDTVLPMEAGKNQSPDILGEVEIVLLDDSLAGLQKEIYFNGSLLVLAGLALTSLLALLLSQRVLQPILRLSEAVTRVKRGEHGASVPATSGGELGILEEGFNAMATRVAMTQEELLAEVAQTTEDLQITMNALEERNIELDLERKKAVKASQAKSDFLASMSHEIRTPMNGIIGFARLLQKSELSATQAEQLAAIHESADNLLNIINDILDFSKLESGRITFHSERVALEPLLDGVVTLFLPQAEEKQLQLEARIQQGLAPNVLGDRLRIRQVLVNIVGNALKFTERGSISIEVRLDPADENTAEVLRFSVRDTGIGLDQHSTDHLFQAFTQADTSTDRKYGGTGLGLSICRKLVEGMQGRIGVNSVAGEGSTFWFTLPYQPVATDQQTPLPPHSPAANETREYPISGLCILAADDNAINLKLTNSLLEAHGVSVTTVSNGQEAVTQAQQQHFDLILMDVHMPGLNGTDVARLIRSGNGPNADAPIIAVTADVMPENRRSIHQAGMNDMLSKPLDEQQLIATIASYFNAPAPRPSATLELPAATPADPRPTLELSVLPDRDLDAALQVTGGNQRIAAEMFEMLLKSSGDEIAAIRASAAAGNWESLWEHVHRFKGAAAACGVPALHQVLQQLAKSARQQDAAGCEQLIQAMDAQIARLHALTKAH